MRAALVLAFGLVPHLVHAEPYDTAALEKFRAAREARLKADDGWLAVAGLYWLEPGRNRFGTDPDNELVFPKGSAPPLAGTIALAGDKATLEPAPGVPLLLNGAPAAAKQLAPDSSGKPDVMKLGDRLTFFLIERGGKLGLRLRDLEKPARKAFTGLVWYPPRPELRVVAKFVPHAQKKSVGVPNVLGQTIDMESPGKAVFKVGDKEVALDALYEEPGATELFFVFSDATMGKGTYPGGRFLYTDLPRDGTVVLDFNRAYNPPCAVTEFATCPLPPPQNKLTVPIEAGEKYRGPH